MSILDGPASQTQTYLDKAKEKFPHLTEKQILASCPEDFELETHSFCPGGQIDVCERCWGREFKPTLSPQTPTTKQSTLEELYDYGKAIVEACAASGITEEQGIKFLEAFTRRDK